MCNSFLYGQKVLDALIICPYINTYGQRGAVQQTRRDEMHTVELNGSEKQVAWAEEIRALFNSKLSDIRFVAASEAEEYWPDQAEQIKGMVDRLIDCIQNCASAKAWIDANGIIASRDIGNVAGRLVDEARRKIGGDNRLFLSVLADFEH